MRKLIAVAILLSTLLSNLSAQLQGINIGQLTNMMSPARLMQAMPNANQGAMFGLDPATMKLLGAQEPEKKNETPAKLPGAVAAPTAGDAAAAYLTTGSTGDPFQMLYGQVVEMQKLQDSISNLNKKIEGKERDAFNAAAVWGHEFFKNELIRTFTSSTDVRVPDSYIINVDDEITLAVWGYAVYNGTFKVNKEGYIQIPEFGRVYVKGLSFGAAKSVIAKRLSSFINPGNTSYEITMNTTRNIIINILGEVNAPGTYQMPAVNSVFSALNSAAGPTTSGSVRNIEVRRDGKTIQRFDLYEFLLNPTAKANFYLDVNDIIYVPIINKVVEVSGAVKRPKRFELKANEGLKELLFYAGGTTVDAYTELIRIERLVNQKIETINLNMNELNAAGNFALQDGDKIFIPKASITSENSVEIAGTVLIPDKYQYRDNSRISDLIKTAGGLLPNAYLERAYLRRKLDDGTTVLNVINLKNIFMDESSADNVLLQKKDHLEIFSKERFVETFQVSITGSVRKPVKIDFSEGMTLNDLIFYAGGLKKEAANNMIEISRVMNINKQLNIFEPQRVVVKTIEIGSNLEIDDVSKGYELAPMDHIYVRRTYDFDVPMNIDIVGEVKFPGTYPILSKGETVLQLIERAGGLTPYAHIASARLFRKDTVNAIEVLDLREAFSDSTAYANYALMDNDVIEIPTMNPMVSVKGAIKYPGADSMRYVSAKFIPGKTAKHYVNVVGGGYAPRAKRKHTIVLHPNGDVGRTKSVLFFRKYAKVREGSQVLTYYKPPKPEEIAVPKQPLNWNLILPSLIIGLTSVASTALIISILRN
jgi:protein involved in polysaccharide export with SLBB domain